MSSAISNVPFIQVKNLQTKFDTQVISNSFITLIGDPNEAHFLHQLHYWSYAQYGVVIDGIRWIYKPMREWLTEVFPFMTEWKLRKAIASLLNKGLIDRKKLYVKHHEIKHDNPYWNPKNQTYYYSVNYDELQKRIDEAEQPIIAGSTENIRIEDSTKLSVEESLDTKCCEVSQNKTDITSTDNKPIQSHPTLPCESEDNNKINQGKSQTNFVNSKTQSTDFTNPKAIAKKENVPLIDEKINKNKNTNLSSNNVAENTTQNIADQHLESQAAESQQPTARPKVKTLKGTKSISKRAKSAPWKDEEEFKAFYRALIQAVPIVANARSPQGLTQTIIRQLRSGIPHTYWDDFASGMPIGFSTKPEWEIEPGVPYPMFIEYLTEKIIRGNNTQSQEQARNEVFRILSQPRQAMAFWGQFKCSVVNVSEQLERDRALGVSNPSTPVWTRERVEPSIEEAAAAGKKITAVNDATLAAIESSRIPQLESKDSPSVPQSLNSATSTSPNKSEEVLSSPDPWDENGKPENDELEDDKPTLSMREILAERGVKGFCSKQHLDSIQRDSFTCKEMPKVSKAEAEAEFLAETEAIARQQMNRKVCINKMSLAEINELLTDPIMRKELTPQIIFNDKFEMVTDNLGEILSVSISQEYLNNGGT